MVHLCAKNCANDLSLYTGNESEIWVAVARAVWEQTTVDTTWLAEHLHLRSAANASQQIRRHRQHPPPLSKALQRWILQSENVA